jgi:hypothetical protein
VRPTKETLASSAHFDGRRADDDADVVFDGGEFDARDVGATSRDNIAASEGFDGEDASERREDEGYSRPTAERGVL